MKIRIAILLSVLLLSANAHAEDFARVLSVTQGVSYALDGKSEALAVKMDVPIKANISSDATGKAQMIFPDDSTLTIAPNTKITLSEYTDTENEENILLNLVSGTARIITGESNRRNPQAFTVNTPQASIGIRGTLVTIQTSGDLTRVYLTETSGKGVSVRNLHTGKVMELRKPGRIITVGPDFMEERKARKEEAAAFNAALRGKSLMAQKRERDRAERLRNMPATSLASGTLPPAGLGEITQAAAFERDEMLSHATLVADNTPAAPITPVIPAAPAVSPVTTVPTVPNVSVEPYMPTTPTLPEPPAPVPDFEITSFSQMADAKFIGTGNFDFYIDNALFASENSDRTSLLFPKTSDNPLEGVYNISGMEIHVPAIIHTDGVIYDIGFLSPRYSTVEFSLNMNGEFVAKGEWKNDKTHTMAMKGYFTSFTSGIIQELRSDYTYDNGRFPAFSILKEPMIIEKQ